MEHKIGTRALSLLLTLVMVFTMIPTSVLAAGVNDSLVTSLAEVYDGDEARAREELEALYEAGIIDADGNMVSLDIREDGQSVELDAVAQRIADGEAVGALTVNGNEATPEKIMQISQVDAMLEVLRLIDKDVEITDEHVANLQSLIESIADGSIDISDVISRGEVQMSTTQGARLLGADDPVGLPENTGSGTVDATDGTYTAPYISDSSYEASHSFALDDPENKTWYTTSSSAASDVVVTISIDKQEAGMLRLMAVLNKTPSVPVSIHWSATSGAVDFTGYTSDTITWDAETPWLDRYIQVKFEKKGNWVGSQSIVINADNITNATFEEGKTTWSKTVQITAEDLAAVSAEYPATVTEHTQFPKIGEKTFTPPGGEWSRYRIYSFKTTNLFPSSGRFKATVEPSPGEVYLASSSDKIDNLDDFNLGQCVRMTLNENRIDETSFFDETSFSDSNLQESTIVNGEVWVVLLYSTGTQYNPSKLTVSIPEIITHDEVMSVSAPAGTYYSGQVVPVTVTLKEHAVAPEGTTLTVNGVQCPMLNNAGTEAKTFTFGYTVKGADGVELKVTALSDTFINAYGNKVSFDNDFPTANIGTADGVILSSDTKLGSLDWENVKFGIDDADAGDQTVTVVIPFQSGVDKAWITNETVEINPAISMPVPGYEDGAAGAYLTSAYFSADGGATRYPVYVLGDNADALAVRFAPAGNSTSFLRQDTLSLYLDTEVGTTANYLGAWTNKKVDAKGFAYFTATGSEAPMAIGKSVSYFVKGGIAFDAAQTIDRPNYAEANIMKNSEEAPNGFYKEGALYVAVQGEDASKQHDVELVANEALYKAVNQGVRAENPNPLILSYQFNNRDKFGFTNPKFFTWSTSDEQIATVVKDEETGAGQIALTGAAGAVTVTLTVGNGADSRKYDLTFPAFTVLEGQDPFLNIPAFSRECVTLTDTDTDVLFASNVTARNAAAGKGTTFTAKLYRVGAVDDTPEGDPIWTGSFASTVENTLTHITVPASQLPEAGTYAVVISVKYEGGEMAAEETAAIDFSATAYLTVKQAPFKVKLNTLGSYSVDYSALPAIGYTVTPSTTDAVVKYTVQKSGEEVGEPIAVTDGVIPFTAGKPAGLKEAYTITVYAKAKDAADDEPWSMDSMVLRVYNMDTLELIIKDVLSGEIGGTTGGTGDGANGTTVTMDNHSKVEVYPRVEGKDYQLSVSDLNALRTDMSLQKIISVNYGSGVWGLLSDKMQWESSDSDLVSVNYKQGGFYSDIRNYSYTSYGPATDFLLVGKDETKGVTITATHAGTGKTASVTVAAETLKDQLYVFQFNPKVETDVVYTNGAGEQRTLKSDENGVLAVYEPEGIASSVMVMSQKDGQTYVGTIFNSELESGERDIASLKLYPCNNLRLRSISNLTLSFRKPDGSAYNGSVTLRAGVYKNGIYCPEAKSFLPASPENKFDALQDITATVTDGKLTLGFNPTEFKNDPENALETGAYPADKVTYAVEYRVEGYQTSYALVSVNTDVEGEQKPTDSVIQLRAVRGGADVLQIIRQTIRQYSDDKPVPYTRDVTDFSENIGISKKFDKVVLTTDFVLPDGLVTQDAEGHRTLTGEFALYTVDGQKLTDQTEYGSTALDTITNLDNLDDSNLFVFPFSSSPIGRHEYTMTDENMAKDGISDVAANAVVSSRVKATFVRDGMTLTSVNLPFRISNLSHQQDLMDPNSGAEKTAADIKDKLKETMSIGEIFKSIDVNSMLKKGFTFLSGLQAGGGDTPFSLIILPTEDPGIFRIVAFVGKILDKDKEKNGISIDYDTEKMYEDFNELMENDDDDDDDDDDDYSGEGSYDVDFSGTLVLEAGYDFNAKKWKIDFRGGKVGVGFKAKYEWSQNFMCGPVPANISFEVGANAVLEVSFASKSSVKLMLVDATVGVYIEAFAGLGFDVTIAKLKLGIYGRIGADVNFLLLSDFKNNPTTGTKLDINGEIGIRLEVKVLFVKYKKTFASTGFNWSKKWNKYDNIQEQWKSTGYADLMGVTASGRAYSMRLLSNGTALVTIEGGGEIENRDYLELANRAWNSGASAGRVMLMDGSMTNALTIVQTNAYPYANPVLTDDGDMFLYISDNDNANELQSVVSYAEKSGNGYENKGALYDIEGGSAILADSDVVASGTGSNAFAAWVKQMESPDKEMHDATTYDDLGMMMNATEVYAGVYDGSEWTTTRLTDNSVADMAPTVASYGNHAIVAWRSLSATSMPEDGSEQDFTTMFNAENNVNYRIWNGSGWTDALVAYNGATGTVNAIDSAMLSDGTALLTYTVRTGEEITSTETFYTVIGTDGNVLTTGRLTNDSYADTNAQVTAVGSQFVLGWYSEHDTGEMVADPETEVEKEAVAHDIRLARINADGSVDANFPESIGGDSASAITSDFRFSAPANNSELSKLAIVWSQMKDSESADDAGKYEMNAVRFYETTGANPVIGVTAQTDIAETGKNVTVDHFDTYTDASGKVYALVLGSDYSSIEGIDVFDRIDLSNLPVEVGNGSAEPSSDTLTILEQNPVANIKLGSGSFPEKAVEVTANANLRELVTGLDLPVQFTVKNTGASSVDKVTVQLGTVSKTVEGLALLPNQSTILTVVYPVPEGAVQDVGYTVTADEAATVNGTLVLNRPDVGISGMKLLREKDKERDVQVTLYNASGIPLAGSGKSVKLAFYKDSSYTQQVGSTVDVPTAAYADIDEGIYSYVQKLNVSDFIESDSSEIPDEGIHIYARAWVDGMEELYTANNASSISFKGLLTKYESVMTMDTFVEENNGQYTVKAFIRNNSLQNTDLGSITADILDDKNNVLESVELTNNLMLTGEHEETLTSEPLTIDDGTPSSVALRSSTTSVILDATTNGGVADTTVIELTKDGTLPALLPSATKSGYTFNGWYTEPTGGEKITAETVFGTNEDSEEGKVGPNEDGVYVIYAQFTQNPSGGGTPTTTTVTVPVSGEDETVNVTVRVSGNTATITAPTDAQMEEIVGKSKETGEVTIDLSSLPEDVTAVSIPAKTVKAIDEAMEDTDEGLTIKLPTGNVTFEPEALASIAAQTTGKDLKLNVDPITESKLNAKQKEAVADLDVQAVYDIYLTSDGNRITDFGGGKASVEVTYKLKDGQQPGGIVAWYVADDGKKVNIAATPTEKTVKFTATHFSNYVVAYDETLPGTCVKDDSCPMTPFNDLDKSLWYHDGVHWALENGVMKGVGNNLFDPNGTTSRAMIVTMLYRMEGDPEATSEMPFDDVPADTWYTDAVAWAEANGIVNGVGNNKFAPNTDLTREQLVTILQRYANYKGIDTSAGEQKPLKAFDDTRDISDWAVKSMRWAVDAGIINGTGNGKISPKTDASRAQVATMLMRYCTLVTQ